MLALGDVAEELVNALKRVGYLGVVLYTVFVYMASYRVLAEIHLDPTSPVLPAR